MGFFSIAGSILTGLFGGGSGGSNQDVVSKLADKILPETAKELQQAALQEQEEDIKDVSSARAYNAPDMPVVQYQPGMGLIPFFLFWVLDLIDRLTDSVNHIIRPGFFIWLAGGFLGVWPLIDTTKVDPQMWSIFMIVVTFFFGGRALVKDILPGVGSILKAFKKK